MGGIQEYLRDVSGQFKGGNATEHTYRGYLAVLIGGICNDVKVFINSTQYFDGVPETAWNFYIGGYQPAQKWLKDRKGRRAAPSPTMTLSTTRGSLSP